MNSSFTRLTYTAVIISLIGFAAYTLGGQDRFSPLRTKREEIRKLEKRNAEPANVAFVLDRSGLRHYFRVVIDGDQVRKPKPDPEMYLLTARRLGVRPSQAIVFEDSEAGLTAARAAGMRTVGVRTTHSKLPGAGLEIDDFLSRELEPWLRTQTQPC